MAAGDVTIEVLDLVDLSAIGTAIANMRNTANDKWLLTTIRNGQAILVINIEEA